MADLLLGPVLRYAGRTSATVWLETDGPGEVAVECEDAVGKASTWSVFGRHYALVVVEGLAPGRTRPYRVRLDGRQVWPPHPSVFPDSVIRTAGDADAPQRIAFGSCRWSRPPNRGDEGERHLDPDVLDTLALQLARGTPDELPDALLLLGDQVYADEVSHAMRDRLARRRGTQRPPGSQVRDFDEYALLYHESWGDPQIRWLLSTVPSAMIFDDHEIIDDWNTSRAWRREMAELPWWEERIVGAFASYWVYQHLGNLAPDDLAADPTFAAVRAAADNERSDALLRTFAVRADATADADAGTHAESETADSAGASRGGSGGATQGSGTDAGADAASHPSRIYWSFRRDFGRTRLVMLDTRAGRVLQPGARSIVNPAEFSWVQEQFDEGGYDHLLVGSSLPWLLPRGIHDLESWNEALCDGTRGSRAARWSEKLRRAGDLEHWAAFRSSFEALAASLRRLATHGPADDQTGTPPATVCVLSGDVHHAYAAEAQWPQPRSNESGSKESGSTAPVDGKAARVLQLTCSPLHNSVPPAIRLGFRFGWSRPADLIGSLLARHAKLPEKPVSWRKLGGPWFGNHLMTLVLDGRRAELVLDRAVRDPSGTARLRRIGTARIS
ncbi:alkaline phosphatase D family protein [Yinghuangia soli]|uniref:Alkaline phosphatase family protein n=1 Tax=Yinghuangia soli TaxID=2908204 RepID=A0AA41Q3X7_9ACTN|nr:alkaline phosphatase D family protein [Yinghuangia soli]MCF2529647.1 alkaline phosphatase family protein [Yinghuangia soli]